MTKLEQVRNRLEKLIDSNINKIDKKALGSFYKIAYKSNREKVMNLIDYITNNKDKNIKMNLTLFN